MRGGQGRTRGGQGRTRGEGKAAREEGKAAREEGKAAREGRARPHARRARPHARRARPHEHHETDEPVDREPAKDILGCSGPWQGRRKRRFLSPRPILHLSSLTPELLPALIHRSTA